MDDLLVQLALWQFALPLALIAVHAVVPAASRMGIVLRTAAIGLVLAYTAVAGLWLFPPWWTPHALSLALLLASFRHWLRYPRSPRRRIMRTSAELIVSAATIFAASLLLLPTVQGRNSPDAAIDLDMPLGPGRYLVISGGAAAEINSHYQTLGLGRTADYRGQSRGVDIIGIKALGIRASGIRPAKPLDYLIHGREVRAPCAGIIIDAVDGVPENVVPRTNRTDMAGNHVILECEGAAVVLAHFVPGSIRVAPGDRVETGQPIAKVGNSGNSDEPHLHIHVQEIAAPSAPLSGDPLWFTIEDELPTRNTRYSVSN